MPAELERLAVLCGVRVGAKRRVVLRVIGAATGPLSAREIHAQVLRDGGRVSLTNVYHTLRALQGCGLLTEVPAEGSPLNIPRSRTRRYRRSVEPHLERLVDVRSGRTQDFRCAQMRAALEQAARALGYQLLDYRLELFAEAPCAARVQGGMARRRAPRAMPHAAKLPHAARESARTRSARGGAAAAKSGSGPRK